jgi:hypothetical protein
MGLKTSPHSEEPVKRRQTALTLTPTLTLKSLLLPRPRLASDGQTAAGPGEVGCAMALSNLKDY